MNHHLLADVADPQLNIDGCRLVHRQVNAGSNRFGESEFLDTDLVFTDRQ